MFGIDDHEFESAQSKEFADTGRRKALKDAQTGFPVVQARPQAGSIRV